MISQLENDLALKLLALPNSVVIGSTGLEVSSDTSDVDICVMDTDMRTVYTSNAAVTDPGDYQKDYDCSPLLRNATLYKFGNLDIFAFTDVTKLHILHDVMNKMRNYPKPFLRIKWIRIKLFRYLLAKQNF